MLYKQEKTSHLNPTSTPSSTATPLCSSSSTPHYAIHPLHQQLVKRKIPLGPARAGKLCQINVCIPEFLECFASSHLLKKAQEEV
ncbi:hypothetical protein E2C01_031707 [Portunus trituberculatus]|uniref:Uncharacterized protein n=1 Tax=Portunus trituberculatus TaxID=210409 RepID=A0A5B7EZA8_PORTR|nr:hypothetical protein [Portunus trituberculatus]